MPFSVLMKIYLRLWQSYCIEVEFHFLITVIILYEINKKEIELLNEGIIFSSDICHITIHRRIIRIFRFQVEPRIRYSKYHWETSTAICSYSSSRRSRFLFNLRANIGWLCACFVLCAGVLKALQALCFPELQRNMTLRF